MDRVKVIATLKSLVEAVDDLSGGFANQWTSLLKEGDDLVTELINKESKTIKKDLTFTFDELMTVQNPEEFFEMIQVQLIDNITDSEEFKNRLEFFVEKNEEEKTTIVTATLKVE